MKPARLVVLLAAAALGTACAGGGPAAPQPPAARASAGSVQALIGDAACESDAQCATLGVGAKACGGPSAYVAWSRLSTDPAALQAAADREAAEQQRANAASGRVSNCAVTPDPGAWCDARASRGDARHGVCRLRGSAIPTLPNLSPPAR